VPLVPLVGVTLNAEPLHMDEVIAEITGAGLTVAVTVVLVELTQPVDVFLASA
jgi:hypothetical protein